ncbi:MAG: hypothetical protein HRT90_10020 [Candidatus Margulisbacteria bacterium]|nr:hypothetical protein [Candidatus Margulisiibacteriota bacterium]
MRNKLFPFFTFIIGLLVLVNSQSLWGDFTGSISTEYRLYPQEGLFAGQSQHNISGVFEGEYYTTWDDSRQILTVKPFIRWDQSDDHRTHMDIRELSWIMVRGDLEWRVGLRKVFWGVLETNHLVDTINQTDFVENIDGEQKLGQPMVNMSWSQPWGLMDIYVLPWFRERTFPGSGGRFGFPFTLGPAAYESGNGERHVDWALRWFHIIGRWDIGVSYFKGTSRDPILTLGFPMYVLMEQFSTDIQLTLDSWLWKVEALTRNQQGVGYTAGGLGFEYTFYGVYETPIDVGLLGEYHFDERGLKGTTPFQNDMFTGARIVMNDVFGTEFLGGVFMDLDTTSALYRFEGSRRFGSRVKGYLNVNIFQRISSEDLLFFNRRDSYLEWGVTYFI